MATSTAAGGADATSRHLRRDGGLDWLDGFKMMATQRKNMTKTRPGSTTYGPLAHRHPDFLDLVSIVCDIYQSYLGSLIPVQHFHPSWELAEDAGNTSIVTSRSISLPVQSTTKRGESSLTEETLIVKRTKRTVDGVGDSAVGSLVNELLIRSHPPLRSHPNIVNLRGIAWDFEKDDEKRPRPLLVEEFAPHRSLQTFWATEDAARMPFRVKASLCKDIADGITALHACGIVHGDIKPGNILIFPENAQRGPFTAKLTDFGSSVRQFAGRQPLPAWTPWWCAPEADGDADGVETMTFEEMMATDVYSYGLVVGSIVLGRSIFSSDFLGENTDVVAAKSDGRILAQLMDMVIREDQTQLDSDFELSYISSVLENCLRTSWSLRNLQRCIDTWTSYEESLFSPQTNEFFSWRPHFVSQPIVTPPINQPPLIGYRTLSRCGHAVKAKIVAELTQAAIDAADTRRAACAWELCICYFSGFGVDQNWHESRRWLTTAAMLGLDMAQTYFLRLHNAMGADPLRSLLEGVDKTASQKHSSQQQDLIPESPGSLRIMEWLHRVVGLGCVEVIPDLRAWHLQHMPQVGTLEQDLSLETALRDYRKLLVKKLDTSGSGRSQSVGKSGLPELLAAVILGDLKMVSQVAQNRPQDLLQIDQYGNTALILASRSGNFSVLNFLLEQGLDAGICNAAEQSSLHFLPIFSDQEIQTLVPKLVNAGADVFREGQPVTYSTSVSTFSLAVRSSPVLYSIIMNNVVLLQALLAANHSEASPRVCRVCEAGSRYRKILAVASCLHCNTAMKILLDHQEHYPPHTKSSLSRIEVWYHDQPVSLHQIPFDGYVLRGLDLPERFVRAVYHGQNMSAALKNTLDILRGGDQSRCYRMISGSVQHDAFDALDYLLTVGFPSTTKLLQFAISKLPRYRPYDPSLYSRLLPYDFYDNAVFVSMRLGNRAMFERLVGGTGEMFKDCVPVRTRSPCSVHCRHPSGLPPKSKHQTHPLNMVQLCLSTAVTASHIDHFFVDFILQHSPAELVLAQPSTLDETLSGEPVAFVLQAVFSNAKSSLNSLFLSYPDLVGQRVSHVPVERRLKTSGSYTPASKCEILERDVLAPSFVPISHFILFVGSEISCRLLLESKARSQTPSAQQTHCRSDNTVELALEAIGRPAIEDWRDFPITATEFHNLLCGLIAEKRNDRNGLWELVKHQLALRSKQHALKRSSKYVKLAIMYSRHDVLTHLEDLGWSLDGSIWVGSNLFLAKCVECTPLWATSMSFPLERRSGGRIGFWSVLSFSKSKTAEAAKTIGLLRQHISRRQGRIPHVYLDIQMKTINYLILSLFALLHLLALPLSVGLSGEPSAPNVQQLKWLWLYCWSLGAGVNLALFLIISSGIPLIILTMWACYSPSMLRTSTVAVGYMLLTVLFLWICGNYIGVPILLYSRALLDGTFFRVYLVGFLFLNVPLLFLLAILPFVIGIYIYEHRQSMGVIGRYILILQFMLSRG